MRFAVTPPASPDWRRQDAVALALLEPGSGWASTAPRTTIDPTPAGDVLNGRKVAVEHAPAVEQLAVAVAAAPDGAGARVVVAARAPGVSADRAARVRRDRADVRGRPRRRRDRGRTVRGRGARAAGDDRGAAGRRRGGRRGRAVARRRLPLRRRAAAVRPHDRQLPGAASPAGGHVRPPGELVVVGPLRGGRARRGRRRGRAHGVDRQGVRVARGPRGRARRDAGLRRASRSRPSTPPTASCAGSSCASSSSATPPTTSARSAGRSRPAPSPSPSSDKRSARDDADDRDRIQRPHGPAPGGDRHGRRARDRGAAARGRRCTTRAGSAATSR